MNLPRFSGPSLLSWLLSAGLLTLALGVLWLKQWLSQQYDPQVIVRQVTVGALPPPPPPPPPMAQSTMMSPVTRLQVAAQGVPLPMQQLKTASIEISKPTMPTVDWSPADLPTLAVNWDAYDLNALDALPSLLTPVKITLPQKLQREGVKSITVKLDVMIDQQGRLTLIDIIENPYPELLVEIQKLVRLSRFSPPIKADETVRARFIWPIVIKS